MSDALPTFETLVDLYQYATAEFASRELFGTKKDGRWVWTTYGEFRDQTEAMRGGLAEIGIGRGDRVVIISVERSHKLLRSNVSSVHQMFPMDKDHRSLSFLPWAHSFGQTCELHTLLSMGASMGLCENVSKIIDNLAEVRPTLLFSVPRIFNKLYAAVQKQISERPEFVQNLVKTALTLTAKERDGQPLTG